jgi:hypothetical protein
MPEAGKKFPDGVTFVSWWIFDIGSLLSKTGQVLPTGC